MKKEIAVTVILLALLIGDLSLLAWPSIFAAQSSDRKPPKKEKFGSSLKRLRWDPNKQAGVENEQDNQKRSREIGPGDVIKVETNLVVLDLFVTEQTKLRALTGLGKDDFVVTEDGVTQQISMFSVGADPSLPRSIVLIIDFSSSMSRYLETGRSIYKHHNALPSSSSRGYYERGGHIGRVGGLPGKPGEV
jgi:hypothetical protein